jgi:hypothetical protein
MMALLGDREGGELIIPPSLRAGLSASAVQATPVNNIRAGIGYLLMRMASFAVQKRAGCRHQDLRGDRSRPVTASRKLPRRRGSTPELMKKLNPSVHMLKRGEVLKYQKGVDSKGHHRMEADHAVWHRDVLQRRRRFAVRVQKMNLRAGGSPSTNGNCMQMIKAVGSRCCSLRVQPLQPTCRSRALSAARGGPVSPAASTFVPRRSNGTRPTAFASRVAMKCWRKT